MILPFHSLSLRSYSSEIISCIISYSYVHITRSSMWPFFPQLTDNRSLTAAKQGPQGLSLQEQRGAFTELWSALECHGSHWGRSETCADGFSTQNAITFSFCNFFFPFSLTYGTQLEFLVSFKRCGWTSPKLSRNMHWPRECTAILHAGQS